MAIPYYNTGNLCSTTISYRDHYYLSFMYFAFVNYQCSVVKLIVF